MPAIASFLDMLIRSASVSGLVLGALKTTIVACAALAVLALWPRAAAALRHLLSVSALASILVLPLAAVSLPVWSLRVLPPRASESSVPGPQAGISEIEGEGPLLGVARFPGGTGFRDRSTPVSADPVRVETMGSVSPGRVVPPRPFRAGPTLLLVWLTVSALLLARIAFGHVLAWRLARRAEPVSDGPLRARLDRVRTRLGLRTPVALRQTPRITIPVVTGFRRPVLLVPGEATGWSAARAEAVFTHELAHVRRGDALTLLLAQVATALHWYQPLAWMLARSARLESERACDDVVLGCGIRASDYAEHLFQIATRAADAETASGAALAFARRSHLEGRLVAILAENAQRTPVRARAIAAMALVAAVSVGGFASVRVTRAESGRSPAAAARVSARSKHAVPATAAVQPVRSEAVKTAKCTEQATETRTETRTATSETVESSPEVPEAAPVVDAVPATEATPASWDKKGDTSKREGEEWFDAARRAYNAEHYEESAKAYRHAADAGYRAETALYNAACSYSLAGMKREAIESLAAALEAGFDRPDLVSSDSDLDAIRGEPGFDGLLGRALNTPSAREGRREAVERFEEMRKEGSRADDEWRSLGIELMRAREFERALTAFDVAYRIDPSSSDLYNKACALALSGDTPRAMEALRKSIEQGSSGDPAEDSDLASLRGRPGFEEICRLSKDLQLYDGNIKDDVVSSWRVVLPRFERVTREHPAVGRAWFNLGYAQLRVGDTQASEASNKRALELGYRPGTTMYNLACVAARRGDADAAMDWLAKSESAGMKVWKMAPGDQDLDRLHSDPRFRAQMERWDREVGAAKREKQEKRESKQEKRKT
jgi:beta-lactamase regulating signal transducer with metallopeptidase domain